MNGLHSSIHNPLLREWNSVKLRPEQFVYPVFVTDEDENAMQEIKSLPGQYRFGLNKLVEYLSPLVNASDSFRLRSVIVFGVPTKVVKDYKGSMADDENGPVIRAIKTLRKNFPQLLVCADVCMCAYTEHGHCGILNEDGTLNNDRSIARLAEIAGCYAKAGCHVVAPSDMMDFRVKKIKEELKNIGKEGCCAVWSYSSKFASAFYGPFRDAANSAPKGGEKKSYPCAPGSTGNRKCYQLPPGSRGLAVRASDRDANEGADLLMVKPSSCYGHIIHEVKQRHPHTPMGVYHVSGEYAMLWHAAEAGVFDLKSAVFEVFSAMTSAGADVIITYYTPAMLQWLREECLGK